MIVQQDGTNYRAFGSRQLLALFDLVIGVENSGDLSGVEELQEFSIRMACEYWNQNLLSILTDRP